MYSSTSSTHHTTHTHTPRTCRPQSVLCGARRARRRSQGAYGHAARIQPGRYHRRRCRPTPRAPPFLRSRRRPQLPVRVLQCRHGRTALPRPHRIHRSGAAGHMPGENLTEKNLPTPPQLIYMYPPLRANLWGGTETSVCHKRSTRNGDSCFRGVEAPLRKKHESYR